MNSKGFDEIINDIRNRDDEDIIGLNSRKPRPVAETVTGADKKPDEEEKPILHEALEAADGLVGAGVATALGIGLMKSIGDIFKKQ
jgi:hypothetical protein